ncbi:SDR family NAD(P)-dependent oxidoreductase [Streptomyces acidiscabies]|uniref:Uncharacterized protein n=1 Tax=Streptomyces acidiscabies TaxID=42234 RepID=A0A0L0KP92_9ACTN|nr:SDR family oxidoreductase [Streptomyces acidiscabies]KND39658.1 hypothetical protein IQ63_02495 [Streptomyces acidiscabies]
MRGLEDKRVIVAGSATGIGAALARRLTEEGARVLLGDINTEGVRLLAEEIGAPWRYFDLADDRSVAELVAAAQSELGGLDGVANVAADLSPGTVGNDVHLLEMDPRIWQKTLDADLIGFARIIKNALPPLVSAGGGSIVNVSSEAAVMGETTRPAYAAAKAGVEALTRHVASTWGKDNIRCNAVAPGLVIPEGSAIEDSDFVKDAVSGQRIQRVGRPADLASTISFLLSAESEWITGQTWSVNAGCSYRR